MLRYCPASSSSKEKAFTLPRFPARLEHLAVDLRFIASLNNKGETRCLEHGLHCLPGRRDI